MRKVMGFILGLAAYGFTAISSLTIPNETISAGTPPQVVWVDQNFDSVTAKVNQIKDSINLYLVGGGSFLGTSVYSNSNLRLGVDNDANGTGNLFWFSHNATDSLFRIKDDSTWRAFGAGVGTKLTLSDSILAANARFTGSSAFAAISATTGTFSSTLTANAAFNIGASGSATLGYMVASRIPYTGASSDLTSTSNLTYTPGTTTFATANAVLSGTLTLSGMSVGRLVTTTTGGTFTTDNFYVDAVNDRLGIGSGASSPATDFDLTKGTAGTATVGRIYNTDNTNTASNAILQLFAGGASGGDPFVRFNINGATDWVIGPDNTDSDALVFTPSTTPGGATNAMRMTTAGAVTIPGTLGVTGALSSGALTATTGTFSSTVTASTVTTGGGEAFTYGDTSFTITVSDGWTVALTGTVYATKIGRQVTMSIPYITGTSNSANAYFTGIPSGWRPTTDIQVVNFPAITNNGTFELGRATAAVRTDGSIRIYPSGGVGGWTSSGTKEIGFSSGYACNITFSIQN